MILFRDPFVQYDAGMLSFSTGAGWGEYVCGEWYRGGDNPKGGRSAFYVLALLVRAGV